MGRPPRRWLLDLQLLAVQSRPASPPTIAASNGTSAIPAFRSAASRRGRCSIQPRFGVAYDLTGPGQDGSPRRMGPLLLPLRPVHQRPGRGGRRADRQPGQQRQRRHRCWRATFRRSTLPPRRSLRRRWTARTISSLTPTATASRFRSERRGPACWRWPMSATSSRDLAISTGAGSNINLVPVGAMLSSKNGGVDPNSLNGQQLPAAAGLLGSEPGHQQGLRQLQRPAGHLGAHQGPLHHQHELHLRQGHGHRQPGARSVQPEQRLRRAAHQPHPHLQRGLLDRTGQPDQAQQAAGRPDQRLAAFRNHCSWKAARTSRAISRDRTSA